MTDNRPTALQLCPFSPYLEAGLNDRFKVVRWFDLGRVEQEEWLHNWADSVVAIVTGGHVGCSNKVIGALPSLGIVAINGVGADKVDIKFAETHGVRVTTTPDIPTDDAADLTVGLIICLLREIPAADAFVRSGQWVVGDRPLARKVSGRRFGIVGLGNIGSAIAARLTAFGPVAYTGPRRKPVAYTFCSELTELARMSDVLILACPANDSTRHLICESIIDALGPEGYLINVARGAILDEKALIGALKAGNLAGAALDVFENEPHVPAALRDHPRVVLTPHIASATVETRQEMADLLLSNLDEFIADGTLSTSAS